MLAEVKNAWRGAMAVWNILDRKYLPPFIPDWAKNDAPRQEGYFRMASMDTKEHQEIWDLRKSEKVSEIDKVVLLSTFDNVIVWKKDLPDLIEAFRKFEGETSLKEQADIIEKAFNEDKDLIAIGWNQTSVNGDTWRVYDKRDNEKPYNLKKNDKHWSFFEED